MLKELKEHKLAYIILIIGLVVGIIMFLGAWPDRNLQRLVAACLAGFYLLWGLVTHFKAAQLTHKIVLEYLAVSFLAGLLLILITI